MQETSFLSPERAVRAARVRDGMYVADFGASSGFFARAAARAVGPQGRVFAVDSSRDLLLRLTTIAKSEGLRNIEVITGNVERRFGSFLPEETLDMVIAANILFSAENKHGLIEEIWRVLKSPSHSTGLRSERGGRLLIIDWTDSFGGLGPAPSHIVTQKQARDLLESGGFSFVEEIPAGTHHWGMLMRKR